jgi:hypothetical protein
LNAVPQNLLSNISFREGFWCMEWVRVRAHVRTSALTDESYDEVRMYFLWGKENIKNNVFWDVKCVFGGAFCLHLQYSGVT